MTMEPSIHASAARRLAQAGSALSCLLLAACAGVPGRERPPELQYPLSACEGAAAEPCLRPLFRDTADVLPRTENSFPARYLELSQSDVRDEACRQEGGLPAAQQRCQERLKRVAEYFELGRRPGAPLGVALEGGGTKAAPFALGTLAALQQLGLLDGAVGAVSSISGGSYAASYYFNRRYDQAGGDPSTPTQWFQSCIPQLLLQRPAFIDVARTAAPGCGESPQPEGPLRAFDPAFAYIGHVWTNADLLRGSTPGHAKAEDSLHAAELANLGLVAGETLLTIPFQFVGRSVFHWPLNTAPSKLAYKLGLERQYGYSPQDWAAAGDTDLARLVTTLKRRKTRTLNNFHDRLDPQGAPLWVIGTTAPNDINGLAWLKPSPRDPVRQQFEFTPYGFGSGTFGYVRGRADAPYDFIGPNPDGMPVLDAVVASAAFFDDNQSLISEQPGRFLAGAGQHFANVTWFSEIRNPRMPDAARAVQNMLPWPLYTSSIDDGSDVPYIHLQDGGNTDNTGLFALLRRGYRTIVYAHGTEDAQAEWAAICHLKNQLELDGKYLLRSPGLDQLAGQVSQGPEAPGYLDRLCNDELDASDLAAFDLNRHRTKGGGTGAVNRLYCARLGQGPGCKAFTELFGHCRGRSRPEACQKVREDMFFQWPRNGDPLTFQVYRGNALQPGAQPADGEAPLSTIIAIVPALNLDEAAEMAGASARPGQTPRDALCEAARSNALRVRRCLDPEGRTHGDGAGPAPLACAALSRVMDTACRGSSEHFPQESFIVKTIHSSYLAYAGYYELARQRTREAVCRSWGTQDLGAGKARPAACEPPR